MSYDLDDYYDNRVKHKRKKRKTYPNPHDTFVDDRVRRKSESSLEEMNERYVIKEYSKNRLKTEIVLTKQTKVHPDTIPTPPAKNEDTDYEIVLKCAAIVIKKLIKIMSYFI